MQMDLASYEIDQHRHEFAVWTAHRAAFRGQKSANAYNVRNWFGDAGFSPTMRTPEFKGDLCQDQKTFDDQHRNWRGKFVESAASSCQHDVLTHGRAAKAINIYLKTRYVLAEPGSPYAAVIHPPIDRILLMRLGTERPETKKFLFKKTRNEPLAWTKLSSDDYEHVIGELRQFVGCEPFWKVELFWSATQPLRL